MDRWRMGIVALMTAGASALATLTCVDRSLADSLQLPEARGQLGMGMGIQGDAGSMRLVDIDSISVGDARAEGLTGCALDFDAERLTLGAPRSP